jgi:adenylate kinase
MKPLIICISGTPGTGKTVIATELKNLTNANMISVNSLIKKGIIKHTWDNKRKTKIVDVVEAERAVRKRLKPGINIVDSHYSHLMKCDICVVLRTNPAVLMKRLKERRWKKEKIRENVMAEILGEIAIEAKDKGNNIIEIDTSKTSPERVAGKIKSALNTFPLQKDFRAIDWTKRYTKLLLELGKGD